MTPQARWYPLRYALAVLLAAVGAIFLAFAAIVARAWFDRYDLPSELYFVIAGIYLIIASVFFAGSLLAFRIRSVLGWLLLSSILAAPIVFLFVRAQDLIPRI
jgi:drug/metabolite transporter (DMT)-like permease